MTVALKSQKNSPPISRIKMIEKGERLSSNLVFKELDEKYSKKGNVLAGFRLRNKLTQIKLAEMAGTTQSNIAAMENGKRKIGKTLAQKFAIIFKTDYKVFLQ